MSLVEELEAWIGVPLPVDLYETKRKYKKPSTVVLVRRSGRLAAKARASNPTLQAQNVPMQKLGVANAA